MTEAQKLTWKRIDEILWFDWDPIGINDAIEARDEYYSYVAQLFRLKINKATKSTIVNVLYTIETGNMGLLGNMDRCKIVAEKIVYI